MDSSDPLRNLKPALPRFVAASPEEILYAQELRRRIEERYLGQAHGRADVHVPIAGD